MVEQVVKATIYLVEEYGIRVGLSISFSITVSLLFWKKGKIVKSWVRRNTSNEEVDEIIESTLASILWKLRGDRAYIFEYRKYNKDLKPIPYEYTDCTAEVLSPTACVGPEKENLQGINLAAIPFWTRKLSEAREVQVSDVETIRPKDETTYKILERQHIESVYAVGLVDFRGHPLGFLGVDYCQRREILEGENMQILRYEALKVTGLLSLRKKRRDT